jgi:hypothetical protein
MHDTIVDPVQCLNTPTLGDINPGKEDHYVELILSITTHNKAYCCVCLFLILVHLLLRGSLPLNMRDYPLSHDYAA